MYTWKPRTFSAYFEVSWRRGWASLIEIVKVEVHVFVKDRRGSKTKMIESDTKVVVDPRLKDLIWAWRRRRIKTNKIELNAKDHHRSKTNKIELNAKDHRRSKTKRSEMNVKDRRWTRERRVEVNVKDRRRTGERRFELNVKDCHRIKTKRN